MSRSMEKCEKEQINEWFQNHVAQYDNTLPDMSFLSWKRPDSDNSAMIYQLRQGYLTVLGDVGTAVYHLESISSFKEWAECDLYYFSSKCLASEDGRLYEGWNIDYLLKEVKRALNECGKKTWKDFKDESGATTNEIEWTMWLTRNGEDFFGDPPYWPNGRAISIRCRAHLMGLKMAVKQLKPQDI